MNRKKRKKKTKEKHTQKRYTIISSKGKEKSGIESNAVLNVNIPYYHILTE